MDAGNIPEIVVVATVLIIAIIIDAKIAKNMQGIAADKGYEGRKYWHYCFWLGLIGYAMIIAMPDRKAQEQRQAILNKMQSK